MRATQQELDEIARRLMNREALPQDSAVEIIVDQDLEFLDAVVAASHNPFLMYLDVIIREPFRSTLLYTFHSAATIALALKARRDLFKALHRKDPVPASKAAERAVGIAMLSVEEKIKAQNSPAPLHSQTNS